MELLRGTRARSSLYAAIGLLLAGMIAASGTAQAQTAEELCTPDVMRLCNEYIPNADRIVVCLKAKRRLLSVGCRRVMASASVQTRTKSHTKTKKRRARHHHRRW